MVAKFFLWLAEKSPNARRFIFRVFFQRLAAASAGFNWWTFMNFGYAPVNDGVRPIPLEPRDEPERTCAQLYHHLAGAFDLSGKDVLEVSCGRGGGASYLCRYLGARSVTGIDISANAIDFCRRVHRHPNLRFLVGDAENIPAPDRAFDVVINVEASFCYGDIDRFFAEVGRVLRPGGHFLYTDLRFVDEIDSLLRSLRQCRLVLVQAEDITENVSRALAQDSERRTRAADRHAPLFTRRIIRTFAGAEGTRIPYFLKTKSMRYLVFVLRRADRSPS